MAAIQKIRSYGPLLIAVIALGLFAFIAEDGARAVQTIFGLDRMQAGKVYSDKLSVQEYQGMIEEATQMYEMRSGQQLSRQQQDQIGDQVWQEFVSYKLVEHEAEKLGLRVTEDEVQNALRQGTAQSLQAMAPFVGQNGKFDYVALQNFYKQYNELKGKQTDAQTIEQAEKINKLWEYTLKQLRKELLMNKYNALLTQSFISNPVTAKAIYDERTTTRGALVASMATASVEDKEVGEATDSELKDMYQRYKELFRMPNETRDIKFIDVAITASKADVKALDAEMQALYNRLAGGEDAAIVVNGSKSTQRYANVPLTKSAFPYDIQNKLDSMAVGTLTAPYDNAGDNTKNVVKLIAKFQAPDSVLYRTIFVQAETEDKTAERADSIVKALNGGAKFQAIAKNYGQPGDSAWVRSSMYENSDFDEANAKYVTALNTAAVGSITTIEIQGGRVLLQVLDRKAMVTKYNAAVIKCPIDFSKDTRSAELTRINKFLAQNTTLEAIEKNAAKAGYVVRELKDFMSSTHNVAGVASTKEAVRWIFDEAERGDVSKLYECGENNDHLLVVALTGIHEKGYREWDDEVTKEVLTQLVMNEKKGAKLAEKFKGVKSLEDAQAKGFVVDSLSAVTFAQSPFVQSVGAPEPVLSAVVSKLKVNQTSGLVKGGNGVYVVKVISEQKPDAKYDEKQAMEAVAQGNLRVVSQQLLQSLMLKADVMDNRYKF